MTSRFVDSVDSKKNNAKFTIKLTNYILFSLTILPVVRFVEFFFLIFSFFRYYSLPVLENNEQTSLLRSSGYIYDHFSSSMCRQPAM